MPVIDRWYKRGHELLQEIEQTKVHPDSVALWFLGQSGLVVKGTGPIIYFDPFLSPYLDDKGIAKRDYPPPFDPVDVHHAGWVFCSHDHVDHLDPETLGPLSRGSANARFVVAAPLTGMVERIGIDASRIVAARAGVRMELDGMGVMPVAAAHEEYQRDENGDHCCLGFVVTINGVTLYHAGDTVETQELVDTLRPLRINIACLPINGADWKRRRLGKQGNMNAREAANVAADCGADLVIPIHWDLLSRSGENPAIFVDYMTRLYPNRKYKVMAPGERMVYMR